MFVREAYDLLKQSIIHVDQEDIDFDEEELKGERDLVQQHPTSEDQDVEMSGALEESQDVMDDGSGIPHDTSAGEPSTPKASTSRHVPDNTPAAPPAAPRRRMIITHDKYIQLKNLIILELSRVEQQRGEGLDREELIDWYLEQQEDNFQDIDDIERERELITKMLKKLVKVCLPVIIYVSVADVECRRAT